MGREATDGTVALARTWLLAPVFAGMKRVSGAFNIVFISNAMYRHSHSPSFVFLLGKSRSDVSSCLCMSHVRCTNEARIHFRYAFGIHYSAPKHCGPLQNRLPPLAPTSWDLPAQFLYKHYEHNFHIRSVSLSHNANTVVIYIFELGSAVSLFLSVLLFSFVFFLISVCTYMCLTNMLVAPLVLWLASYWPSLFNGSITLPLSPYIVLLLNVASPSIMRI